MARLHQIDKPLEEEVARWGQVGPVQGAANMPVRGVHNQHAVSVPHAMCICVPPRQTP